MNAGSTDTFKSKATLKVGSQEYTYFSIPQASKNGLGDVSRLPLSLKVLLENVLRHENNRTVHAEDIRAFPKWLATRTSDREIAFFPARVLMQDFTGVPAVVDLAAMRDAVVQWGGNPERINPLNTVDLVIDHSVMVDHYGTADAFDKNVALEFERNRERYAFLRWGQKAFRNFRAVPPGTGICHQVNLEYLARVAWTDQGATDRTPMVFPDTLVGTDSHTTMVNGLSVLGWGVGGIEAEAAMLGQSISMLIPEVIGFKVTGRLPAGTTATDLVLTAVEMLRKRGVVGKFVEFFGPGLDQLTLADRATIANMAPEYGATCGFFPIDTETLSYLRFTGRDESLVALVEAYAKAQGLWRTPGDPEPVFTDTLHLDLGSVEPCLAGPKRPQDRVRLGAVKGEFQKALAPGFAVQNPEASIAVANMASPMRHGAVVIAAITSCTNTSNPSVLIAAGLLARKARERGLTRQPWVKTSLAPGSQVVTDYLKAAGLDKDLDALGFQTVGYGCTTCIGNSGPIDPPVVQAIEQGNLVAAAVLSGNRNFEGRISPHVRANYLASPALVVAYAVAGTMQLDLTSEPLGKDKSGKPVFLKDIWPSDQEVKDVMAKAMTPAMYRQRYSDVFKGPKDWQSLPVAEGLTYRWDDKSTYIKRPTFFDGLQKKAVPPKDIRQARPLAILGDSVTTDHISPAGSIKKDGPAGKYLQANGVDTKDFNSYGARRGNHEVMMRGTFANVRLKNEMVPGIEGGVTRWMPTGEQMSIYDAAIKYQQSETPLVIVAGKEYGTGSSRDWAAKGTRLLGVRAVIAESFERIHRSNLIGMGVLPLQFESGKSRKDLKLDGSELFAIDDVASASTPGHGHRCTITRQDGSTLVIQLKSRIDTADELEYFRQGGILQFVLRQISS